MYVNTNTSNTLQSYLNWRKKQLHVRPYRDSKTLPTSEEAVWEKINELEIAQFKQTVNVKRTEVAAKECSTEKIITD